MECDATFAAMWAETQAQAQEGVVIGDFFWQWTKRTGPCQLHEWHKPGNITKARATSCDCEILAFHVSQTVRSEAKNARPPSEAIRRSLPRIDDLPVHPRIAIAPNNATEYPTVWMPKHVVCSGVTAISMRPARIEDVCESSIPPKRKRVVAIGR